MEATNTRGESAPDSAYRFVVPDDEGVIFDFDGLMTDCEALDENRRHPYVEAYAETLGKFLNHSQEHTCEMMTATEAIIRRNPDVHGVRPNRDNIVAPGLADLYVRCDSIAHLIFDQERLYLHPEERAAVMHALYRSSYPQYIAPLRPGAKELICEINRRRMDGPIYIVTDAPTSNVSARVHDICGFVASDLVYGNANKAALERDTTSYLWPANFPISIRIPGLKTREVFVRRPKYRELVTSLLDQHSTPVRAITVVGDIWELDLAMWQQLGARVICFETENTPPYLRPWFETQPNAHMVRSLAQVIEILRTAW